MGAQALLPSGRQICNVDAPLHSSSIGLHYQCCRLSDCQCPDLAKQHNVNTQQEISELRENS